MLLVKTSPGEFVDRQVILELKLAHCGVETIGDEPANSERSQGKKIQTRTVVHNPNKINVQPFEDELELIMNSLKKNFIPDIQNDEFKVAKYDELYEGLQEINSKLWDLEDEARVLRSAPTKFSDTANKKAAEVLFMINDLNDRRAELKRSINNLWGIDYQEKMYS